MPFYYPSALEDRERQRYVFAAPIQMDGETVFVAAVVKRTSKNRFYLHEVVDSRGNIIKIGNRENANPTSLAADGDAGTQSPLPTESITQTPPVVKSQSALDTAAGLGFQQGLEPGAGRIAQMKATLQGGVEAAAPEPSSPLETRLRQERGVEQDGGQAADTSGEDFAEALGDGATEKEGLQSDASGGTIGEISEAGRAALLQYKSSASYKINSLLRDGRTPSEAEQQLIKTLDATLPKLPTYQGKVYRRLAFDGIAGGQEAMEAFLAQHQVGSIVPYSAFTSAAKTWDGYPVEGKLIVTVVIEGATGRDLEGYGNNFEQEVIFARDTDFLVVRIERGSDGNPVIYMKEVIEDGAG